MEKSNKRVHPRCLTLGQKRILWSQLVDAYEFDQTKTSIHLHEKLTEQHFHLDPALKMRNHLAEDVLDRRMHYLMVVSLHRNASYRVSPLIVLPCVSSDFPRVHLLQVVCCCCIKRVETKRLHDVL